MSKYTPGPWKAYEASERCPFPVGVNVEVGTEAGGGAKTATICTMHGQGNGKYEPAITNANAHLIAAAPELLEALRKLANEAAGFLALSDVKRHGQTNSRILRDRIEEARAAITKAEGQSC